MLQFNLIMTYAKLNNILTTYTKMNQRVEIAFYCDESLLALKKKMILCFQKL